MINFIVRRGRCSLSAKMSAMGCTYRTAHCWHFVRGGRCAPYPNKITLKEAYKPKAQAPLHRLQHTRAAHRIGSCTCLQRSQKV